MYTRKQNSEIEKVYRVFESYIKENSCFDVVWSDKLGYICLNGISTDRENIYTEPLILREGNVLCEEIIFNMASDVLMRLGVNRDDLNECTSEERKKIREELKPYIDMLPEYSHLIAGLFKEEHV